MWRPFFMKLMHCVHETKTVATNCCHDEFLITLVDLRSRRRWEFDGRKPLTLIWESGESITIKIIRWQSACICKTRNPQSHKNILKVQAELVNLSNREGGAEQCVSSQFQLISIDFTLQCFPIYRSRNISKRGIALLNARQQTTFFQIRK